MTINVNKPDDYIRPYELTEPQSKSTSCHYQMFIQKKETFPPGGPRSSGRSSNIQSVLQLYRLLNSR